MLKKLTKRVKSRSEEPLDNNNTTDSEMVVRRVLEKSSGHTRAGKTISLTREQLNASSEHCDLRSNDGSREQGKELNSEKSSHENDVGDVSNIINITKLKDQKRENNFFTSEKSTKDVPRSCEGNRFKDSSMNEKAKIVEITSTVPSMVISTTSPADEEGIMKGGKSLQKQLKNDNGKNKSTVKKSKPPLSKESSADQDKFTVKFLKANVSDRTWLITPDERKTYKLVASIVNEGI